MWMHVALPSTMGYTCDLASKFLGTSSSNMAWPSGKSLARLEFNWLGKSTKSTGPFKQAMFDYQRVKDMQVEFSISCPMVKSRHGLTQWGSMGQHLRNATSQALRAKVTSSNFSSPFHVVLSPLLRPARSRPLLVPGRWVPMCWDHRCIQPLPGPWRPADAWTVFCRLLAIDWSPRALQPGLRLCCALAFMSAKHGFLSDCHGNLYWKAFPWRTALPLKFLAMTTLHWSVVWILLTS